MQILIAGIIFAVVWYFATIVINLIGSVKPTIPGTNLFVNVKGFAWFFALFIINIVIMGFIIGFYYYKKNNSYGPPGDSGYPGTVAT